MIANGRRGERERKWGRIFFRTIVNSNRQLKRETFQPDQKGCKLIYFVSTLSFLNIYIYIYIIFKTANIYK